MTANPNQHWEGKNHTSVSRFVTRIVVYSRQFFSACMVEDGDRSCHSDLGIPCDIAIFFSL